MRENQVAKLNIKQLLPAKYTEKNIPGCVLLLLEKIMAVDKINKLFAHAPGKKNMEFVDASMEYLHVTCHVVGEENLPAGNSGLIFVSNHPQGGIEAICIAHVLGRKYGNRIKFYANEFLCCLEPLKEMFLPIAKHKKQNRENVRIISDFYKTDNHIIVFPAGVTASKKRGKIEDHEWRKNFIKEAIQNRRDVVPLFLSASNSAFFYFCEDFRRFIRSPINFETILFGSEFFRQRGKRLTLYIGKPVAWETFDKSKSTNEWAKEMRDIAFGLPG